MSNIIVGDVVEGQKWWGVADHLKAELARNHRSNNANMEAWRQVSATVRIWVKMVNGQPFAYIFTGGGWFYQFFVYDGTNWKWCNVPINFSEWNALTVNIDILKPEFAGVDFTKRYEKAALHHQYPNSWVNSWYGTASCAFGAAHRAYDMFDMFGNAANKHDTFFSPAGADASVEPPPDYWNWEVACASYQGYTLKATSLGQIFYKKGVDSGDFYAMAVPLPNNGSPPSIIWRFSVDGSKAVGYTLDNDVGGDTNITKTSEKFVEVSFALDFDGRLTHTLTPLYVIPRSWGGLIAMDYRRDTGELVAAVLNDEVRPAVDMTYIGDSGPNKRYRLSGGGKATLTMNIVDVYAWGVLSSIQLGYNEVGYGAATMADVRRKQILGLDLAQMACLIQHTMREDLSNVDQAYDIVDLRDGHVVYASPRPPGFQEFTSTVALANKLSSPDVYSLDFAGLGWTVDNIDPTLVTCPAAGTQPTAITAFTRLSRSNAFRMSGLTASFSVQALGRGTFAVFPSKNYRIYTAYSDYVAGRNRLDVYVRETTGQTFVIEDFHKQIVAKVDTAGVFSALPAAPSIVNTPPGKPPTMLNPTGYAAGAVFVHPFESTSLPTP